MHSRFDTLVVFYTQMRCALSNSLVFNNCLTAESWKFVTFQICLRFCDARFRIDSRESSYKKTVAKGHFIFLSRFLHDKKVVVAMYTCSDFKHARNASKHGSSTAWKLQKTIVTSSTHISHVTSNKANAGAVHPVDVPQSTGSRSHNALDKSSIEVTFTSAQLHKILE